MGARRIRRHVAVAILAAALIALGAAPALAANPIVAENSRPGDTTWLGAVNADFDLLHPAIEGYSNATSVRPGGAISFSVNVPQPARYRVEIVRLGWYGGMGGRRLECLVGTTADPTCTRDEPGVQQPEPPPPDPQTGEVDAGWPVTDLLQVPTSWVSGYYLAIFQLTTGPRAGRTGFAPFIVQAPVDDRSQILVQVPTNTWQAYNTWGGESLYTLKQAVKVSFNRPYQHRHLFRWEYPLVRFLERGGYDVSYATDDDVDREPSILLDHQLDVTAGHGEYWTKAERDAWEAARAHGVNLAFMGANTGYWQVRYEDDDRTMVSYKSLSDPEPNRALKTVQFRYLRPPRPECQLLGEQYGHGNSENGQYYDYTVTRAGASDPWFAGSGLQAGSALTGLVGFEFDSVNPTCHVPPVTVLLQGRVGQRSAAAVRYRACSGSEVFASGSAFLAWGLDSWRDPEYSPPAWPPPPPESPALQRVMTNAIADMLIAHPRFQASGAIRVVRRGGALRIDPGVPGASVTVRAYALSASGRARRIGVRTRTQPFTWPLHAPRSATAVRIALSVQTGDVRDSQQYLLLAGRHGGVRGPPAALSAASCYGASARVLTPVFASHQLRVAVSVHRPFRVSVLHDGKRVVFRRGHHRVVRIAAAAIPCGRATIVVAERRQRFRLAAIKACG